MKHDSWARMLLLAGLALWLAITPLAAGAGQAPAPARLSEQQALDLAARGEAAQRAGRLDEAIALYSRAIASGSLGLTDLAGLYSNRGSAYKQKGRLEKALADYDRAIGLDPRLFIAYNNRGQLHHQRGDYPRALADFAKAIQLRPDYPSPYFNRSLTYEALGKLQEALADARRFAELAPDHPWAQSRIRYLKEKLARAKRGGNQDTGGKK